MHAQVTARVLTRADEVLRRLGCSLVRGRSSVRCRAVAEAREVYKRNIFVSVALKSSDGFLEEMRVPRLPYECSVYLTSGSCTWRMLRPPDAC